MNAIAAQIKLMQHAGKILDVNLVREWTKQGHHLTGAWEKSIQGTVVATGNVIVLSGTAAGYGGIVDQGTTAGKIPYGGSTGATTSKYITGLYTFWKLRGLSDKEALRAAFATAKTQKKEGMSTKNSARFSETGQRQHFIEVVDKVVDEGINDIISNGLDDIVDKKFHETKSETI